MPSLIERFRRWRMRRRRYYMLNPDKLRPGDIIFWTERAADSLVIRIVTWSKYSHAAIYLGDGLYAEAVDQGVRTRAATTIVKERLKVIRLKGALGEQFARAAAGRIDHYLHSPYALGSAMLSLAGKIPSADARALFCSQLVAQAYADVNVAVVPGYEPVKITPKMLATSRLFDDVTATAAFATRVVPEYLVSGTFETLSDREVASVEKMYRELCPFFVERAIPPPSDWIGMLNFLAKLGHKDVQRKLDHAIQKAMQNAGYIELLGGVRDEVIKPFEAWLAKLNHSTLSDEDAALERFSLKHNLKALERQAEIDLDNQRFWAEVWDRTGLDTFRVLTKYAETQHLLRQKTIKLTVAAIEKLGPQPPA
jgi:hypothetical protein